MHTSKLARRRRDWRDGGPSRVAAEVTGVGGVDGLFGVVFLLGGTWTFGVTWTFDDVMPAPLGIGNLKLFRGSAAILGRYIGYGLREGPGVSGESGGVVLALAVNVGHGAFGDGSRRGIGLGRSGRRRGVL